MKSMRSFKNLFFLMLAALVLVVAIGCGGSKIKLSFEDPSYSVEVGKEITLAPKVENENDEDYELVYSSESDEIATYKDGKVKGIAVGETKVKVALKGSEDKIFAETTVKVVEVKKFKVTFNTNGGSAVTAVEVEEGKKLAEPTKPTRAGHVFTGWFTDSALKTKYDFSKAITAELTLYAGWEIAEYTVTFDVDGGSAVEGVGVNHGGKIEQPEAPTKANHKFIGWFEDEALTKAFDFETEIVKDLTLYAKWELNSYNVIFNTDGGSSVDTLQVKHGSKATEPAAPTKEGFVFDGWYKDKDLTTVFNFDTAITGDTVIFAKWEVDMTGKFVAEFEVNGGRFSITSMTPFIDAAPAKTFATKAGLNPSSTDYYVAGDDSNHKTYIFIQNAKYKIAPSVWQNRIFINRNADGLFEIEKVIGAGGDNVNPTLTDYEYVMYAHSDHSGGYGFLGGLQAGQIIALEGFEMSTQETFDLDMITIKVFDKASATLGNTIVGTVEDGLVLPVPEKEGFIFGGWYDNADFTGSALTTVNEAVKLYAKWDLQTYNATLELNGGKYAPEFIDAKRLELMEEFLTDIYNFVDLSTIESLKDVDLTTFLHGEGKTSGLDGLFANEDLWKLVFSPGKKGVDASTGKFLNQPEYNVKWMPLVDLIEEYIKLNPDQDFWSSPFVTSLRIKPFIKKSNIWGGWIDTAAFARIIATVPAEYLVFNYNEQSDDLVLPLVVKEDHVFKGWYDNAEFKGDAITKIEKGTSKDVKLYAKFEIVQHTVEFETNEGSAVADVLVDTKTKLVKPEDPTKEGFMFLGWFTDEELTKEFNFDTLVTKDLKLYASWVAFVEAEVDYAAKLNEERQTYYIKVTVPGVALLESDIKSVHTFIAAGEYVTPEELAIVAGDPYLWFGVAKLDADLGLKEEGLYAYKVVRQDDSVFVFSFEYDKSNVTDVPDRLGAEIDYKAIYNETRETYYVKVTVANEEKLDAESIKGIRVVKEAGKLIEPKVLTPDTDIVLWFGVADAIGIPTLKLPGLYAYEVVREDDSVYVFEFEYDPALVTELPEVQDSESDYEAVWNETLETWFIKVTTDEDLDEDTIKSITVVMEADKIVDPVALTPNTDKVLWFAVADKYGQLLAKEDGTYLYVVVRNDDTEYAFTFVYDSKLVTGIMHTLEFESNEGSVVEEVLVEKGEVASKPQDPTKAGYTFLGWFADAELKNAFDWEQEIKANHKLYAKWEIVEYSITYELNGGEFVHPLFATKEEMMEAFLTDFYAYLSPSETLETFMHGSGKTSGYKGTWHATHKAKIYEGPRPEAVNEAFFASSSKYMVKWLPFLDFIHDLVVQTNNTQFFWGGTWTGLIRIEEYFTGARYGTNKTIPSAYKMVDKYNVTTADLTLRLATSDRKFLGWYDNPNFVGEAITKIKKGSTGNITLYAMYEGDVSGDPSNVDVSTYEELVAALDNEEVLVINLLNDIVVDEKLVLMRDGVTVNGNGFELSMVSPKGWQGDFILQIYKAQDVVLKDLSFKGGDAALLVNGATVLLEGTITLKEHEFGGIEVAKGVEVETDLELKLADGLVLTFADEGYGIPVIWEDKVVDSLVGADDLNKVVGFKTNQVHYYLNKANTESAINYELNGGTWGWTTKAVSNAAKGIEADSNLPVIFMQDFFVWLRDNNLLESEIVDAGLRKTNWEDFSKSYTDPRAIYNWAANKKDGGLTADTAGYNQFFLESGTGVAETGEITSLVGGFFGEDGYKDKYATLAQHIAYLLYERNYGANLRAFWDGGSNESAAGFLLDGYFYGTQGARTGNFALLRGVIPTPEKGYKVVSGNLEEYVYDFLKSKVENGAEVALSVPSREGYFFVGWYDNPEFTGEKITKVPAGTKPAAKYYAKWESVLPEEIFTISEAKALDKGSDVITKGIVTAVIGNNVYIQDDTGGLYLYLGGTSTYSDILVKGNLVKIYGEMDEFNKLIQVKSITDVVLIETNKTLPAPVVFEELVLADLLDEAGKLVNMNGLTIKSIPNIGTGAYSVVLTNGTDDVEIRVDQFVSEFAELKVLFESAIVGQKINLKNVPVGRFHEKPQFMVSSLNQVELVELTNEQVEAYLEENLNPGTNLVVNVNLKETITVGGTVYTVTWLSDKTDVISNNGEVTRPAEGTGDALVKLTATVKLESEIKFIFEFDVKVLENEDLSGETTYNESFTGFVGSSNSYVNETFTGTDGIEWTVSNSRKGLDTYKIDEEGGLMFRAPAEVSATIQGGISSLSLDLLMAYTGGSPTDRKVTIFINDNEVGSHTLQTKEVETLELNGLNISGEFTLKIVANGNKDRQITIDNLSWTTYSK